MSEEIGGCCSSHRSHRGSSCNAVSTAGIVDSGVRGGCHSCRGCPGRRGQHAYCATLCPLDRFRPTAACCRHPYPAPIPPPAALHLLPLPPNSRRGESRPPDPVGLPTHVLRSQRDPIPHRPARPEANVKGATIETHHEARPDPEDTSHPDHAHAVGDPRGARPPPNKGPSAEQTRTCWGCPSPSTPKHQATTPPSSLPLR